MPPMLLLKGDKQFYGEMKPAGSSNQEDLKKPAPPPDLGNVPLTNDVARDNHLTENIKDPYHSEKREGDAIEKNIKDVEKLKNSNDLGSRFVSFLQTPIVSTDKASQEEQKQRELSRIGVAPEPVDNNIRPVGEVPYSIGEKTIKYFSDKFMNAVVLLAGVYLAGQFLQGVGRSSSSSSKKESSSD